MDGVVRVRLFVPEGDDACVGRACRRFKRSLLQRTWDAVSLRVWRECTAFVSMIPGAPYPSPNILLSCSCKTPPSQDHSTENPVVAQIWEILESGISYCLGAPMRGDRSCSPGLAQMICGSYTRVAKVSRRTRLARRFALDASGRADKRRHGGAFCV